MKIQIVSDIHIDINKDHNFGFINHINNCDLTLIAGDIAGSYAEEEKFLDKLVKIAEKPVLCVGGNHLGYNYRYVDVIKGTKYWSLNYLSHKYNNGNVRYLNDDYFAIGDYIVFGGTMYSDFNLYGNIERSGKLAERGLNDFIYVRVFDGENIRKIKYTDYIEWFNLFINKLENCINHNQDKKFIVLTHFAPSSKSLDEKYVLFSQLNPAYASDLEGFIQKYPQIKIWTHGHIHSGSDYKIGDCRVVCNPYGYAGYEQKLCARKCLGKVVEV